MAKLLAFCQKHFANVDFETRHELHSENEILMDWTLHITSSGGRKISIPMKTQIKLEKREAEGLSQRVAKIQENWNGRELINRKNTSFPGLGLLQMRLRRGVGFIGSRLI